MHALGHHRGVVNFGMGVESKTNTATSHGWENQSLSKFRLCVDSSTVVTDGEAPLPPLHARQLFAAESDWPQVLGAGHVVGVDGQEPLAAVDDAGTDSAYLLNSVGPKRIVNIQHWRTLTRCADIWIWESVKIVFVASIKAGEVLLNQERK